VSDEAALEHAFAGTQAGDAEAFAAWVHLVELPLRANLLPFARTIDVEAVFQEGLLRMWKLAPVLRLSGPNASLRYAFRLMRNLALSEARRATRLTPFELKDIEDLPEAHIDPTPPDPVLRRLIVSCLKRLPGRPREVLLRRLADGGHSPDRALAETLRMEVNTFLQNIVRARKLVAACLEREGVRLEEVWR
jgi:DNA-directed RNA polymerase specialized sigma24 family protein